jgi:hypothetical protein
MNQRQTQSGSWLFLLLLTLVVGCRSADSTGVPRFQDESVLFADDFSNGGNSDWFTEADDQGQTAVLNESMIIEIGQANLIQFTELREYSFDDFFLEVDVTQLAGDPESSYGILFRMRSPDEFYRFEITSNGRYMIERHNADGTWTRFLDDWLGNANIEQGLNVTNKLGVAADGPLFIFYINSQPVQQITDPDYVQGSIALSAGTFGQPGLSVAFDNVVIRQP